MLIDNKIDNLLLGPVIFVGYLFLITGIFILFQNAFIGISIIILASFFTFSYSGVEIDTVNRRIKQYNKFFGLIKTGIWKNVDAFHGLTIVPMRNIATIASRANLTTSSTQKDYRIFMVNKANKPAFAIKKCKTPQQAQTSIDEFSIWLKLPVYTIRK